MTDEITVGMAVTDAQKQGIYHLRYQVYVEDLCLMPEFADHQQKTLAEPIDAHAKLFFAEAGGEIVGTMRINLGLDGPLEHESLYDLHKFVPYFPTCVAMCTKFAVARKKRGSEVARRLIQDAYVYLRERGILFVFIDCWPHLLNLYEHLGFRRYRSNIRHPEAGYMTPMVFVFDDVAHFELINSPLAPVAKQFPDSNMGRDHFANTFPEFARYGCQSVFTSQELFDLICEKMSGSVADVAKLFSVMNEEEAQIFIKAGHIISCQAGDRIISFGEMRREMYTVLTGAVEVRREEGNALVMVMSKGETFGEVAQLSESARTANVNALEDCELLVHDFGAIQALERDHPLVVAKIYRNMARILSVRLVKVNNRVSALHAGMERLLSSDKRAVK